MSSGATPSPSRIGRPNATSRSELEHVAIALFVKSGFDETSIDDIAAAAGISRRTFFRYYPSKLDLVWGDFDAQLILLRDTFDATPARVSLMEAIRRAVVSFNAVPEGEEDAHRQRLGLILGVPTLLANSTLRFTQWRAEIARFAAQRTGSSPGDLLPTVIGHCALGASLAAYEQWLADPASDLSQLIDQAHRELARGFRQPKQRQTG